MKKKAEGLPLETIVLFVIILIVLIVMILFFSGRFSTTSSVFSNILKALTGDG